MIGQDDITWERLNTRWWAIGLGVVLDVPKTGCAILRRARDDFGNVEGLAGRVSAEEGGELCCVESLVLEELVEGVGGGVDVGEESGWGGGGGVLASHEELHLWSSGAGDNGDCSGHLDHVGDSYGAIDCNVFLLEGQNLGGDVLEAIVVCSVELIVAGRENETSVTTTHVTELCFPRSTVL